MNKRTTELATLIAMAEFQNPETFYKYKFGSGTHKVKSGFYPFERYIPNSGLKLNGYYKIYEDGRKTLLNIDGIEYNVTKIDSNSERIRILLKSPNDGGIVLLKEY